MLLQQARLGLALEQQEPVEELLEQEAFLRQLQEEASEQRLVARRQELVPEHCPRQLLPSTKRRQQQPYRRQQYELQ